MHSTVKLDCVRNYCLNEYNSRFVKDAKCWVSMMESLQMLQQTSLALSTLWEIFSVNVYMYKSKWHGHSS